MKNADKIIQKISISTQLNIFTESLGIYTDEYEQILITIAKSLPKIEKQIDNNVLEARELLNFIFTNDTEKVLYGVKHELDQFHQQLNHALETLKESESLDKIIFTDLKKTIDISNSAINKIQDIFNISENLKVFAINSIVYSQKEGARGKGYQIISGEFIKLSEEIAKGTEKINHLGKQMDTRIVSFLNLINEHEDFTHQHIQAVSMDSQKLMKVSDNSVKNFSLILNDLLNRIESVKTPTYKIMIELQRQDIIQQQMKHLVEAMDDIKQILDNNSALLDSDIGEDSDETRKKEYISLYTLLDFLLLATEKQMLRINQDILNMVDNMDGQFSLIRDAVKDIDVDKKLIGELVIPEKAKNEEATIIHLIFMAPEHTIEDIINNLGISQNQKKNIIKNFKGINELLLFEKELTVKFIPIIESINNLLLLARIEQARNSLKISSNSGNQTDIFSQSAFAELSEIIDDMDESHRLVGQNLMEIIDAFETQKSKYQNMETNLKDSLSILGKTETLFKDNYFSVMEITDTLSLEINKYTSLFERLRLLYKDMDSKINICTDMKIYINNKLERFGGPVNIEDCLFKDVIIQKIVDKCTVKEERITLSKEFSELEIEESTGSSITLF